MRDHLKQCAAFTKPLWSWDCSERDACAVDLGVGQPEVRACLCPPRSPPSQASLLGLLFCFQVNHSTDSLQLEAFVGEGGDRKLNSLAQTLRPGQAHSRADLWTEGRREVPAICACPRCHFFHSAMIGAVFQLLPNVSPG